MILDSGTTSTLHHQDENLLQKKKSRKPVYNLDFSQFSEGTIYALSLMEDYDFTRRLERTGTTCCIEDPPLVTSSRRFAGRRPLAIVWGWLKIHALYHLGVSPDRLARLYDSERRRTTANRGLAS